MLQYFLIQNILATIFESPKKQSQIPRNCEIGKHNFGAYIRLYKISETIKPQNVDSSENGNLVTLSLNLLTNMGHINHNQTKQFNVMVLIVQKNLSTSPLGCRIAILSPNLCCIDQKVQFKNQKI